MSTRKRQVGKYRQKPQRRFTVYQTNPVNLLFLQLNRIYERKEQKRLRGERKEKIAKLSLTFYIPLAERLALRNNPDMDDFVYGR